MCIRDRAKAQKVDLAHVSILALVTQYLAFVKAAKRLNLELAADYLVMAAVLAYLKSRLLLPPPEADEETQDPTEAAAALALRLKKLQAMKDAGEALRALPQLGQQRFATQRQPAASISTRLHFSASLFDVLNAYAAFKRRRDTSVFRVEAPRVMKFEEALARVQRLLRVSVPGWTRLQSFLPEEDDTTDGPLRRSAFAATLLAGLELTRQGKLELRQDQAFGPVYLRTLEETAQAS